MLCAIFKTCTPGYTSLTCPGCVRSFRNPGKSGKFSPEIYRTEFPGISGNFFRGFPGIPEIPGNFFGNLGIFPRTRAAEQGTRR